MAVVVVDGRRFVFGVLAGESPRIRCSRFAAGDRQCTERCVLVVRGNVVVECGDFGDVLVAVVSVEECRVLSAECRTLPRKRTRCNRLGRIPDEIVGVKSWSWRMEVSNLQVSVVDEALSVLGDPTTHAVITHGDDRISVLPTHRAVLAVVGDLPDSRRGFHQRLVAVGVVLRNERINRHILVEVVRRVGGVHVTFRRSIAVADVVEVVAVAVGRVDRGSCAGELAAGVVAIATIVGLRYVPPFIHQCIRFSLNHVARQRIIFQKF